MELELNCDRCGKLISKGSAYVSINRNIEQLIHNVIEDSDEIEVIDSFMLLALCPTCGNKFSIEQISNIIKVIPTDTNGQYKN